MTQKDQQINAVLNALRQLKSFEHKQYPLSPQLYFRQAKSPYYNDIANVLRDNNIIEKYKDKDGTTMVRYISEIEPNIRMAKQALLEAKKLRKSRNLEISKKNKSTKSRLSNIKVSDFFYAQFLKIAAGNFNQEEYEANARALMKDESVSEGFVEYLKNL